MAELTPTDRELEILKVLWQNGEASVYQVAQVINESGSDLAYTSVLSLLQIMERKGLVDHRRTGKAYAYFPKVEREPTFRRLASGFLDKVFDGAVDQYLVHALESRLLSDGEFERLEALLLETRKQAERHRKKGRRT